MCKKNLANKTITNVTLKTSAKMAVSRQVNGALVEGTVVAPLVEKLLTEVLIHFCQKKKLFC
jgi:hypothetical protein